MHETTFKGKLVALNSYSKNTKRHLCCFFMKMEKYKIKSNIKRERNTDTNRS